MRRFVVIICIITIIHALPACDSEDGTQPESTTSSQPAVAEHTDTQPATTEIQPTSTISTQPSTPEKTTETTLLLSDYPNPFKDDTIIVIGKNASQAEVESAEAIAANLKDLYGNDPVISDNAALMEDDKVNYNLIVIGTPDSNDLFGEVYNVTDATRVTNEYPGVNKGILEIIANPWDDSKALLIVVGSDEKGVTACAKTLTHDNKGEEWDDTMMITRSPEVQQPSETVSTLTDEPLATDDPLFSKYEAGDTVFERYEIGNKIVYFHQRMIGDAIVEGDFIRYQFDIDTEELLGKDSHWRDDLPETLPEVISKEAAEAMVDGTVQFSRLYFISPESDIYPIKPTPSNPCWIIRVIIDDDIAVKIIDAVTGELLGSGVPPPPQAD